MTLSPSQVIERADRIRALAEAGLAGREIAAQMGLHYQTIRLTCRAFGINPIKKYDGTRVQKATAQSKARVPFPTSRLDVIAPSGKWDTCLAWVKPDASPRFNGQGAARGFENAVAGGVNVAAPR